jgi:hypothetical protein
LDVEAVDVSEGAADDCVTTVKALVVSTVMPGPKKALLLNR